MKNDELTADALGSVLLIGVTGGTGHQAVRGLRARGIHRLRAMTRDPDKPTSHNLAGLGVELVTGDLDEPDSLLSAMQGSDTAYLHALSHDAATADPNEVTRGENVVTAAKSAGIRHLVYNSADGCDRHTGVDHMDNVAAVERALDAAAIPNTALRAALFMEEWYKGYTRPAILQGRFSVAHSADFVQQYISVRDMGWAAAHCLLNPQAFIGRKPALASDALSCAELAKCFAEAQGSNVEFATLPLDVFRNTPGMAQMVALIEWYERDGYHADPAAVRDEIPGLLTMREFLKAYRWGDPDIDYASFSNGSFDT